MRDRCRNAETLEKGVFTPKPHKVRKTQRRHSGTLDAKGVPAIPAKEHGAVFVTNTGAWFPGLGSLLLPRAQAAEAE